MESYYNANASNNRYQRGACNSNCQPCDMQRSDMRNRPMPNHGCQTQKTDCGFQNPMMTQKNIQDNRGRSIEVECVCQVTKDCHKNDPMEELGCRFPIAMAYVPWQQWGELYEPDCALAQGTVFKDLNKIFCGVRC